MFCGAEVNIVGGTCRTKISTAINYNIIIKAVSHKDAKNGSVQYARSYDQERY